METNISVTNLSLTTVPFFEQIKNSKNVLLIGCGGGYDIYSGIPLLFALEKLGKNVSLANISFTNLHFVENSNLISKGCLEITADSSLKIGEINYFPELYLSKWFKEKQKRDVSVFAIQIDICDLIKLAFETIIKKQNIDT